MILSGPSGVGKTTIARAMREGLGAEWSVSLTTREQTVKDGADYRFVSHDDFRRAVEAGELLEWAEVFGNCYGTPKGPVEAALGEGRLILVEIDVQGAIQVKGHYPEALAIFVEPPSEEALLTRLRERKRESEEKIQRRFAEATREIRDAKSSGVYDVFVVNDDLAKAVEKTDEAIRGRLVGAG